MKRSSYRNLMILLLVVCFGAALYVFRWSQDFQTEIADRQSDITRLSQELENARSLDVALTELDNLTITEQTSTQLDILRHLGLEQSDLGFVLESRDVQTMGNTNLYIHNVRISGPMTYESAMALSDRLQNTKKIVLKSIELTGPTEQDPLVQLVITGRIYGLDKTLPAAGAPAQPAPLAPAPVIPAEPAAPVSPSTVSPTEVSPTEPPAQPSTTEVAQ